MFGQNILSLHPLVGKTPFNRHNSRNGGIGRHEGLKIPWPGMAVRVRVPLAALCPPHMKHFLCIITTLILLTACGVDSGHFKISGRFLNMSQGNFYVYSPEGIIDGIDTISVVGGRFTYERPLEQEGTLMLVFPNFSEHPVFAEPGKSVTINADASHMKEMEVKGTKANEQMTKFRKQTAKASPPETVAKAEEFINDHPESPVSVFLLKKYFVQPLTPDYAKAERLATTMLKEQPKNGQLGCRPRRRGGRGKCVGQLEFREFRAAAPIAPEIALFGRQTQGCQHLSGCQQEAVQGCHRTRHYQLARYLRQPSFRESHTTAIGFKRCARQPHHQPSPSG